MNYTHYKKIKKLLFCRNKSLINHELELLMNIQNNSISGLTNSQLEYKYLLEELKECNSLCKWFKLRKKINSLKNDKVRVVFFCNEFFTFPSFLSVYNELNKDNRFICDLVYLPFNHNNSDETSNNDMNEYKKNGYSIINYIDYDICDYSPDVAFYLKAYDLIPKCYYIEETKYLIDKVYFAPYGMEIGCSKESFRYQFQLPLHDVAWKCLSYSKQHYSNACKYSNNKGKNYWPIGHPRMDLTKYKAYDEEMYKKIMELSSGRPIIMYNTHFTIDDGDTWGTFKKFGMDILRYFEEHDELFLVYRPHPFLMKSLKEEYKNDKKFWKEYNHFLSDVSNIFYDNSSNYLTGFNVSSFLISDATSFVPEYLMYNKPVVYTKKENTSGLNCKELEKMTYVCNDINDVYKNIKNLLNGKDIKGEHRLNDIKEFFYYDDNKSVALKVKENILESLGGFDE